MIFNSNKQYKCAGDAYSRQYTTKLDKDDYILRLQVNLLNKLINTHQGHRPRIYCTIIIMYVCMYVYCLTLLTCKIMWCVYRILISAIPTDSQCPGFGGKNFNSLIIH